MSDREYFGLVARRPGMYVGRESLERIEAFLTGYNEYARRFGHPALMDEWRAWLERRLGHESNLVWSGLVRQIALPEGWESWDLSADKEKHVIRVLFELLDQFLAEREPDSRNTGA
ncbi:hypothetical protein KDL01_24190 [Actinospica durhamensis]|uniref:Uncharacterized protein n=1 Tax=Actinospica durhamensis TaxID=1508375 RepID=A0A941IPD0_9ACTN|nr:hypothetical protein [Actinospica durhamensis]MBR7836400.1 hypothetical protein [Actinospica durhamensis]